MRRVAATIFVLLFFAITIKGAYAALPPIQDTIETIIGAAPAGSGTGGTEIASWAEKISSGLSRISTSCGYTVQTKTYTNGSYTAHKSSGACWNGYLCSNLVVDSYNLSGYKNSFNLYVWTMARDWAKKGWTVLKGDNKTSLSAIQTGDAIFMGKGANGMEDCCKWSTDHHTVVIASVDINSSGNGVIKIAQANSLSKWPNSYPYYVRNWQITVCYNNSCPTEWWFGLYPR